DRSLSSINNMKKVVWNQIKAYVHVKPLSRPPIYLTHIIQPKLHSSYDSTKNPRKNLTPLNSRPFLFQKCDYEEPLCSNLVELIEDFYAMSLHWSNLKNKNKLSGRMSGIGFCGGYEQYVNSSFPSGTYAVCTNLSAAHVALDKKLQQNLLCHNQFFAQRFRYFSQAVYNQNRGALQRFGIPSCHINPETGTHILPPSTTSGHVIRFPEYDCNINFGTTPGIIEVFWKSKKLAHHTLAPPPELKITESSTHFGCSFQISHMLVSRAVRLKNMSSEERKKRKTNHEKRSRGKPVKK
ncbi:hypothetical protein VP01_4976g2, partial [Puccinia sorghi]